MWDLIIFEFSAHQSYEFFLSVFPTFFSARICLFRTTSKGVLPMFLLWLLTLINLNWLTPLYIALDNARDGPKRHFWGAVKKTNFRSFSATLFFHGGKCSSQLNKTFDKTPKKFHQVCGENTSFSKLGGVGPPLNNALKHLIIDCWKSKKLEKISV
jgi:hypothetical protein